MKTTILTLALSALFVTSVSAQDVTTVNAMSSDISDNLDLRAVASVFGDSENLEDFERRLNDPKNMISNLDLNNDGRVDYLRIVESVEKGTHLIVIQSVLAKDVFQDVATVEVERDGNNQVQVQVVGDVYMYGPNYIYEPVYVHRPVIYSSFWIGSYHPYHSPWYWNYYPVYYTYWAPCPVYQYRRNVYAHINHHHHYNYASVRRSQRAVALHQHVRSNGYERQNPGRSFTNRTNATNRYEYDRTRGVADSGTRNNNVRSAGNETINGSRTGGYKPAPDRTSGTRITSQNNSNVRGNSVAPSKAITRDNVQSAGTRKVTTGKTSSAPTVRSSTRSVITNTDRPNTVRNTAPVVRETPTRVSTPKSVSQNVPQRTVTTPRVQTRSQVPAVQRSQTVRSSERVNTPRPAVQQQRSSAPRQSSGQRSSRG